jgi:uncharacterized protein (TIGR03435 family)
MAAVLISLAGAVSAQQPNAPRFEVASIKLSKPEQIQGSSGLTTGHGRLTANNVTLKRCIMGAYGLGPNQIVGGPDWLDSDRFEIAAKADQPINDDAALMVMLQATLAERFKLVAHRDTKTVSAYILEVGKGGPKLEKAAEGEAKTNSSHGSMVATNITMDAFADKLSRQLSLPVVNRTKIEGAFDLKLQWTPEGERPMKLNGGAEAPEIFAALQEQLGLRLRSEKASVEILVIDHAERPTEN